ncbi:GNAT family N-acetyltransferase [Brevibacillus choshinensis]|uniref:GNAT family N-acetyltransferase n=1 Tax=Brevibacillus choshinensis TaxID=54911 RepID=UPI002E1D8713|nr:GNAT family N-acetyltransferase [Brevibacillus choshinensis]
MKGLTFASHYASEMDSRETLYPLFERVFDIPVEVLKDFYARGFWDPTYCPYTFFDGTRAVANASCFTLELQLGGQRVKSAGIQSVMTHPDYRNRGLMRQLCEQMLVDLDQRFPTSWLFTDSPELYTPFGFRVVPQYAFVAEYSHDGDPEAQLRQIDFQQEQDVRLVRECFVDHQPISLTFAPVGYESSFFLHMYSPDFQSYVHYSERLQAIIVFAVKEQTLHLYDIIGKQLPSWTELCTEIPEPFSRVTLHFCPDQFADRVFTPILYDGGGKLMVRGQLSQEQSHLRMSMTAAF